MPSGKPPAWKASAHGRKADDFQQNLKVQPPIKSHDTQTPKSILL